MKRAICCLLTAALLILTTSALAVSARINTPGGKLNVRRDPGAKSKLVTSVPNHTLVEIGEETDGWVQITYKKKTGYVQREYLLMPDDLVGRSVYADGGTLLLHEDADESSPWTGAVAPQEAVAVLDILGEWVQVACGEREGWIQHSLLSWQREKPQPGGEWISRAGVTAAETVLTLADGSEVTIPAGETVTAAMVEEDRCLIGAGDTWGFGAPGTVALQPVEDDGDAAGALKPMEALAKAASALKKQFKAYQKESLYGVVSLRDEAGGYPGPLYQCDFLSDMDQLRYMALVDAQSGEVRFGASYDGFAAPPADTADLLPEGEAVLTLNTEKLAVGDVLELSVAAWTRNAAAWSLRKDGAKYYEGEEGNHFTAAFRPREAGNYTVSVTVRDENKLKVTVSRDFVVTEAAGEQPLSRVYSQKDGWWRRKAYRDSTLDKSGCAIFTLSHALQRMGFDTEDVQPEKLAKRYALCLTQDGTNNERLLRESSRKYGFTTQPGLIEDRDEIAQLLREGCMFSFSIVRGHIALADSLSEDGTMVHIVDSAPSATFERIVNGGLYYQTKSGAWRAAVRLDDLPGAQWYLNTDMYGGLEYWMTLDYVAKRGVRLIRPGAAE